MIYDMRVHGVDAIPPASIVRDSSGAIQLCDPGLDRISLIRTQDEVYEHDWITLTLRFKLLEPSSYLFHVKFVDGRGGVVCSVDSAGNVVDRGSSELVICTLVDGGLLNLIVTYYSVSSRVEFGVITKDTSVLPSAGVKLELHNAQIALDRPAQVASDRVLSYIDVGARGGRSYELKQHRQSVRVTMFEPEPDAMRLLEAEGRKYAGTTLVQRGLFNVDGLATLYVTVGEPCSSLLEPNTSLTRNYKIGPMFEVKNKIVVECSRYDSLFVSGMVPKPDAIKIDVQGAEYEVLEGFGSLLQDCIGVELETHIYPLYRNQMLITDIARLLANFGLMLIKLEPQRNFDGHLVEFNAWFMKSDKWIADRGDVAREKQAILRRIWFL